MKKFIILIIIVIVIGIIAFWIGRLENDEENNNALNKIENSVLSNKVENNIYENEVNKNKEVINEENTITDEQTSSETFEEEPKTQEEKAIEIVKNDWESQASNAIFSSDGIDENGRYVISVRDKNTTEALAFYIVNVNDKTFTKKEMN